MSTLTPHTKRIVAAGLVLSLGVLAPVGTALADETGGPASLVEPQAADHVYVNANDASATNTYATIQEAVQNVNSHGTIELASDITLNQGVYIEAGFNLTLNTAGHSIIGPTGESYSHAAIQISEHGSLTIEGGGKVVGRHEHVIIAIGDLTLKDVEIAPDPNASGTHNYPALMITGSAGSATIDGATITHTRFTAIKLITEGCRLAVRSGKITSSLSYRIITVPGNGEETISISDGVFNQPVDSKWCAEGYAPRMVRYNAPAKGYTVGKAIERPEALNRIFNATSQFGAEGAPGYELTGAAVNVGTHTTTATPADGYAWKDKSGNLVPGSVNGMAFGAASGDFTGFTENDWFEADNGRSNTNTEPAKLSWTMEPRALELAMAAAQDQVFNGSARTPLSLKFGKVTLKEGVDFRTSYSNNIAVGTAGWKATGMGNYSGTIAGNFQITQANIADVGFAAIPTQAFTGSALTPAITASLGSYKLKAGRDYTLSYKNNVQPGTATVVVAGAGSFTGTQELSFTIATPEPPTPPTPDPQRSKLPKTSDPSTSIGFAQAALAGFSALLLGIKRRKG